jgi:hypothetical protein
MYVTHVIFPTILALLPTIWIVDASNGPGTNFTDLPPAVAAAANGDTIIVRAGSYAAFTVTGKALTIRGAGASTTLVQMLGSPNGDTRISNTPAGTTFYLGGLKFAPPQTTLGPSVVAGLEITAAKVTLADVIIQGATVGGFTSINATPGLRILTSAEVHLTRCTVTGGNAVGWYGGAGVYAVQSYLAVDASTLSGGNQNYSGTAAVGLFLSGGFAAVSRSSVIGHNNPFGPGGAGISVTGGGFVRVGGLATNVVQAGTGPGSLLYSIVADAASSAIVHGGVTLAPTGSVSGAVTLGAVALPYLSMTGTTTPGGELTASQLVTVSLAGVVPSTWFLLGVDLAPGFIEPPPSIAIGELLIPYPPGIVIQGNLDAAAQMQFSMIPAIGAPSLLGVPVYLQFGIFDPGSGQYRLSNGEVRVFQ